MQDHSIQVSLRRSFWCGAEATGAREPGASAGGRAVLGQQRRRPKSTVSSLRAAIYGRRIEVKELTKSLWAFAKLGLEPQGLLALLRPRVSELDGHSLSNALWALATARRAPEPLLKALAAGAGQRMNQLAPQATCLTSAVPCSVTARACRTSPGPWRSLATGHR